MSDLYPSFTDPVMKNYKCLANAGMHVAAGCARLADICRPIATGPEHLRERQARVYELGNLSSTPSGTVSPPQQEEEPRMQVCSAQPPVPAGNEGSPDAAPIHREPSGNVPLSLSNPSHEDGGISRPQASRPAQGLSRLKRIQDLLAGNNQKKSSTWDLAGRNKTIQEAQPGREDSRTAQPQAVDIQNMLATQPDSNAADVIAIAQPDEPAARSKLADAQQPLVPPENAFGAEPQLSAPANPGNAMPVEPPQPSAAVLESSMPQAQSPPAANPACVMEEQMAIEDNDQQQSASGGHEDTAWQEAGAVFVLANGISDASKSTSSSGSPPEHDDPPAPAKSKPTAAKKPKPPKAEQARKAKKLALNVPQGPPGTVNQLYTGVKKTRRAPQGASAPAAGTKAPRKQGAHNGAKKQALAKKSQLKGQQSLLNDLNDPQALSAQTASKLHALANTAEALGASPSKTSSLTASQDEDPSWKAPRRKRTVGYVRRGRSGPISRRVSVTRSQPGKQSQIPGKLGEGSERVQEQPVVPESQPVEADKELACGNPAADLEPADLQKASHGGEAPAEPCAERNEMQGAIPEPPKDFVQPLLKDAPAPAPELGSLPGPTEHESDQQNDETVQPSTEHVEQPAEPMHSPAGKAQQELAEKPEQPAEEQRELPAHPDVEQMEPASAPAELQGLPGFEKELIQTQAGPSQQPKAQLQQQRKASEVTSGAWDYLPAI